MNAKMADDPSDQHSVVPEDEDSIFPNDIGSFDFPFGSFEPDVEQESLQMKWGLNKESKIYFLTILIMFLYGFSGVNNNNKEFNANFVFR